MFINSSGVVFVRKCVRIFSTEISNIPKQWNKQTKPKKFYNVFFLFRRKWAISHLAGQTNRKQEKIAVFICAIEHTLQVRGISKRDKQSNKIYNYKIVSMLGAQHIYC